jgi:hypothetical protein
MRFEEKRYRLVSVDDLNETLKAAFGRYWDLEDEDRGLRLATAAPQLDAFGRASLENWQQRPYWRGIQLSTLLTALAERGIIGTGEYLVNLD